MKLTVKNFRAWLQSKKPDDVVGRICSCGSCPIALFAVSDKPPGTLAEVSDIQIAVGTGLKREVYSTPTWAASFIYSVDRLRGTTYCTARQALEVLNIIDRNVLDTDALDAVAPCAS